MTTKQRLKKYRTECRDWNAMIAAFQICGMTKRDAELGLLALESAGLCRIRPQTDGPTAIELTIPDNVPEEMLSNVAFA